VIVKSRLVFKTGGVTRAVDAEYQKSEETKGACVCCRGRVLRSWTTGILHRRCYFCRRMVMIYGPSISVTRNDT
jgi:hypothetical protein